MPFRGRRRGRRSYYSRKVRAVPLTPITHVPSTLNQQLSPNGTGTFQAVVSNILAGSPGTSDTFEDADRVAQVVTGSKINFVHFDLAFFDAQTEGGIMEMLVVKHNNQSTVPTAPTFGASVNGLQNWGRINFPGRVLHFSQRAIAQGQPVAHRIGVNLRKFRLSTWRQGDFLTLYLRWTSGASITFSIQTRYREFH